MIKLRMHSWRSHSSACSDNYWICLSYILANSSLQTTSAITRAPSFTILYKISSAQQSSIPSKRHQLTIYSQSPETSPILWIKSSMICISLRATASSLSAYVAIYRHYSSMIELIFKKRASSKGSRKLNPKVISGLLAYMAVSYTACLAIGKNSCSMTLFTIRLYKCSSNMRAYPPSFWSQCPKLIDSTTIPLTSRQITLAMIKFIADQATRYYSSSFGQTFLLTRKPRTNACIFLNFPNPSFFIICFGSKDEAEWKGSILTAVGKMENSLLIDLQLGGEGLKFCLELLEMMEFQPAMASSERLFLLYRSIILFLQMSGYGWLTESALMPKKSRSIKVEDESSLFGLKAIISREKEKMVAGETKKIYELKRSDSKKNPGVQERSKRDQAQKMNTKSHDSSRMLQIKQKIYDSLQSSKQNVGKLLVDFSAKSLLEQENSEYQKMREQFYSGKLEQIQQQRDDIGKDSIGQRDLRERLAWEREVMGKLKGEVDEREKVQQVFDRRMHGDEKVALVEVLKQFNEQEARLEEVKKRREELVNQRVRKLQKLNVLAAPVEVKQESLKNKQTKQHQKQA